MTSGLPGAGGLFDTEASRLTVRITLFANAGCAFTCPSKICYPSISKKNKGDPKAQFQCSQNFKEREQLGMIDFQLQPLVDMGFRSFKLLRPAPGSQTGF